MISFNKLQNNIFSSDEKEETNNSNHIINDEISLQTEKNLIIN